MGNIYNFGYSDEQSVMGLDCFNKRSMMGLNNQIHFERSLVSAEGL